MTRTTTPTITLSFDDGHSDDLRTLDLLAARGLKATYYVAFNDPGRLQIEEADIRRLADAGHEIGSHTVSHKVLVNQSPARVRSELRDSKARLEDIVGTAVTALSYPLGYTNGDVLAAMRETGYTVGRTQMLLRADAPGDPLRMPLSVDATPQGHLAMLKPMLRDGNTAGLATWAASGFSTDPEALLSPLLARAARGGVCHIYARSWELTRADRWPAYERILDAVAHRSGFVYATNSAAALG